MLKLKRFEIVQLNKFFSESTQKEEVFHKKFDYCAYRNLEYFEDEIKVLQQTQKEIPKYTEYLQKVEQIGIDCSDKDKDGNPIIITVNNNSVYSITVKKPEADIKLAQLQEEYKEVLKQKEDQLKQLDELMQEEIEINYCPISFKYIPEKYSIKNFKLLRKIIVETDEELEKEMIN